MSEQIVKTVNILHGAIADRQLGSLSEILASNVVLRKDNLSTDQDIEGAERVKEYFEKYIQEFSAHKLLSVGSSPADHLGFAFWLDEAEGADARSSLGIAAYKLSTSQHMTIDEIWLMRQLSSSEAARLLKDPHKAPTAVDKAVLDGDTWSSAKDKLGNDKILQAAQQYSHAWYSGDVGILDNILASDFREYDVLLGSEPSDVAGQKKAISATNEAWDYMEHKSVEALAQPDATRTFNWWKATGKVTSQEGSPESSLFGLSFLLFDKEGKISRVAGFRQPMSGERKKLLK